jgi:hypothetical protein
VGGKQVAQGRSDHTMPGRFSFDETFEVGKDTGTPVSEDYDVPFKFTGILEKSRVDLKPQDATTKAAADKAAREEGVKRALQAMD